MAKKNRKARNMKRIVNINNPHGTDFKVLIEIGKSGMKTINRAIEELGILKRFCAPTHMEISTKGIAEIKLVTDMLDIEELDEIQSGRTIEPEDTDTIKTKECPIYKITPPTLRIEAESTKTLAYLTLIVMEESDGPYECQSDSFTLKTQNASRITDELKSCLKDVLDANGDPDAMDFKRYRSALAKA